MGLTVWDQSVDGYNHAQQAQNYIAIDAHDHSSGKGARIGSASISAGAINSTHLAAGSVTSASIADGAITNAKLASAQMPLGTVIQWWRPSTSVALPTGWVVPTGQTLDSTQHDYGSFNITLPDLRNKFVLGATLTNPGPDVASAPAIGQLGGSQVANLAHSHHITGSHIVKVGDFDDDRDSSVIIRNWDFPLWPWNGFWWGFSAKLQTDSQLSAAQDIRPSYIGLLLLLRVKAS